MDNITHTHGKKRVCLTQFDLLMLDELKFRKKIIIEGVAHKYTIPRERVAESFRKLEGAGLCYRRTKRYRSDNNGPALSNKIRLTEKQWG